MLSQNLFNIIKKSYIARRDQNNKPHNNVANKGISKNGIAYVNREGEYSGFTIQVLENTKPLLTDIRISKAMKFIDKSNIYGGDKLFKYQR